MPVDAGGHHERDEDRRAVEPDQADRRSARPRGSSPASTDEGTNSSDVQPRVRERGPELLVAHDRGVSRARRPGASPARSSARAARARVAARSASPLARAEQRRGAAVQHRLGRGHGDDQVGLDERPVDAGGRCRRCCRPRRGRRPPRRARRRGRGSAGGTRAAPAGRSRAARSAAAGRRRRGSSPGPRRAARARRPPRRSPRASARAAPTGSAATAARSRPSPCRRRVDELRERRPAEREAKRLPHRGLDVVERLPRAPAAAARRRRRPSRRPRPASRRGGGCASCRRSACAVRRRCRDPEHHEDPAETPTPGARAARGLARRRPASSARAGRRRSR